jgi:hypothetical protein
MAKLFELINRINNHADTLSGGRPQGDDQAKPDAVSGESATEQVLGRIFAVPSDSTRVVMFLNDADLKDRYLSNGGEKKVVDALTDDQIKAIFPALHGEQDNAVAFLIGNDFDLKALDKPLVSKRPYAVLFNAPHSIAEKLRTANDLTQAREDFLAVISHKYYVATLNANAIQRAGVGALDDREERLEKFNIKKFVTAFPVRAVINNARAEQDERDKGASAVPGNNDDAANSTQQPPKKVTLTASEMKIVSLVADDARKIFFRVSGSRDSSGWPTTPEGLKELRNKLVTALTKDPRIHDNQKLIPAIIHAFYSDPVKADHHYHDLVELLNADANFTRLAGGQADDQDDQDADPNAQPDPNADPNAAPPADVANKSADEIAADIKAKGDDFADQVAKILSGNAGAAPAASTEVQIPDELKAEVDRLKKVKANAISPTVRSKAAADLAKIMHDLEEKQRPQKSKKAKK